MSTGIKGYNAFSSSLTIKGIPYYVKSCFAHSSYDIHADKLLETCSIAFVVDPNAKIIFVKTAYNCEASAGKIAERLFEGGGVSKIGIGKLNDVFITLSKNFQKI